MTKIYISLLIMVLGIGVSYATDFNLDKNHVELLGEVFHLKRSKKGGSHQHGDIPGGRLRYDRLKRYGYYLGGELAYAKGRLHGSSGAGYKLNSHYSNFEVDGKIGYTFQQKCGWQWALTPFAGIGYYYERNDFTSSAPLPLHSKIHFTFGEAGFIASTHPCDPLYLGLRVKFRFPYDPKCKITHDPDHPPLSQKVGEKWQFRIELPIAYRLECACQWSVIVSPFYDYRPYGKRVNYPFDFIHTCFKEWGCSLGVGVDF